MPALSTLRDNFNDNSLNATLWEIPPDSGTGAEQNGRIELTVTNGNDAIAFQSVATDYTLLNSSIHFEVPAHPLTNDVFSSFELYGVVTTESVRFEVYNGALRAVRFKTSSDLLRSQTYSSTNHRWLRMSATASNIYYETSADGQTWFNFVTIVNDMVLTGLRLFVFYTQWSGTPSTPHLLAIDNVNIAVKNVLASGTLLLNGGVTNTTVAYRSASGTLLLSGRVRMTQLTVPNSVERKTYLYKVYNESDTFLGVWPDVVSELEFTEQINNPGSTVDVELARNSDTLITGITPLLNSSLTNVTDNNGLTIDTHLQSSNQIGPGSNVNHNYRVDIYTFYGSVEAILDNNGAAITDSDGQEIQSSIGSPNGLRLFSGFISDITSQYGEQETTLVTLMSYGYDLDQYIVHSGSTTTITYATTDPGSMIRTEMNNFTTDAGTLTGTSSTIALTGTTGTMVLKVNTYLEMLKKGVEFAPADWFYRLDMGERQIYFNAKPTTADHTFILGKDIKSLQLRSSIEDVVNDVYFIGGETAPEVNLLKRYTASPATGTRRGLKRFTDNRVTLDASASLLSNNEITEKNKVQYRSTLTILDKQYDIESIKLGQLIAFRNFGNYVDLITLMVVGRQYSPEAVTVQLGTLPSSDRTVEELKRSLNAEQTEYVPTAPS